MGLIREPLDVDFYVDPRALTLKEKAAISQHIRDYKEKMAKRTLKKAISKKKKLLAVK
jgi:hypothetical protein